jgi:hypothetical protein
MKRDPAGLLIDVAHRDRRFTNPATLVERDFKRDRHPPVL